MTIFANRIADITLLWGLSLAVLMATPAPVLAQKKVVIPPPPEIWPKTVNDNPIIGYLLFDQLEYRANEGVDTFSWDIEGWLGTDYNKLWLKTENDQRLSGDNGGDPELQLLYSRLVAPYSYFQIGGRYDQAYGEGPDLSRTFGVVSFQTLIPYQLDFEPALFISDDGDVSARLETTYDLFITQRLIAQPRIDTEVAAQEVERFGVGSGFNDVTLDLRLRYEIWRKFAPYVGVSWTRLFGNTADFAREEGDEVDNLALVAGVRLWF